MHAREALRIASGYLRDDAVGLDAALAIRTMAATETEEPPARLSRSDLVRSLIERNASPKVLAQLNEYDEARSEMNTPPQGFVALFNGKNLDGWKIIHSSRLRNGVYKDDAQNSESLKQNFVNAGSFLR